MSTTDSFFVLGGKGAGDGHGCQGDGEVCLTALECAMSGTLKFKIHKELSLTLPKAETPTHFIFMGFDPLIDNAVKIALRETIKFMENEFDIHRDDAYTFCSLAVDLRACNNYKNGSKAAETVNCPTLCMLGEKDKMVPLEKGKKMATKIKNSELNVIKECGHMILFEKAFEMREIVKKFIEKNHK